MLLPKIGYGPLVTGGAATGDGLWEQVTVNEEPETCCAGDALALDAEQTELTLRGIIQPLVTGCGAFVSGHVGKKSSV